MKVILALALIFTMAVRAEESPLVRNLALAQQNRKHDRARLTVVFDHSPMAKINYDTYRRLQGEALRILRTQYSEVAISAVYFDYKHSLEFDQAFDFKRQATAGMNYRAAFYGARMSMYSDDGADHVILFAGEFNEPVDASLWHDLNYLDQNALAVIFARTTSQTFPFVDRLRVYKNSYPRTFLMDDSCAAQIAR